MSRPPVLVCPACRAPGTAATLDADLRCTNPDCATAYARLSGTDVPVLFAGTQLDNVLAYDVVGPLPPFVDLGDRIDALERDGHAWEVLHRAASYVWSHHAAATAAAPPLPNRLIERFLSPLLVATPPHRVLDVACGVGSVALELGARLDAAGARDTELVAIDSNPHALRWAEALDCHDEIAVPWRTSASRFEMRRLDRPARRRPQRVAWICGNALEPPLAGESFDLVLLVNALDSFPDPALGLAQASALLRVGGHLLLAQPDAWMGHVTPASRWLADTPAGWERALSRVGLRTIDEDDGIDWIVKGTERVAYHYRLHARLAVREAWPGRAAAGTGGSGSV